MVSYNLLLIEVFFDLIFYRHKSVHKFWIEVGSTLFLDGCDGFFKRPRILVWPLTSEGIEDVSYSNDSRA